MFKKIFSVIPSEEIIVDILQAGTFEDLMKNGVDLSKKMKKINGMGEKTVAITLAGLWTNRDLIKFLLTQIQIEKNNKTYDKKVCFSKVRDKEFEEFLDKNNVMVLDSLKNDCDLLIVPNLEETSTKIEKAKKKGILVISIDEAYKYFGYRG